MSVNDTLSIERRIAACKKNGADWLVYDPDKISVAPSAEEYAEQRMQTMRQLHNRWRTGLITSYPAALCVQQDGSVGFLYKDGLSEDRDHPNVHFLLGQKNVRKIFSDGRTAAVLYRDGTMAVNIDYSEKEKKDYIRYAKELVACLAPVNSWTGVVDVVMSTETILALHEDGRMSCCAKGDSQRTVEWAKSVSGAKAIFSGATAYYCVLEDGRIDCDHMNSNIEPYKWIKQFEQDCLYAAISYNYVAGLKSDGTVRVICEKETTDFDAVKGWGTLATILTSYNTLVGLTPSGEVIAAGKYADGYKGWTDVALLTGSGDSADFAVRWDGSCIGKGDKAIVADFSWIFEEE